MVGVVVVDVIAHVDITLLVITVFVVLCVVAIVSDVVYCVCVCACVHETILHVRDPYGLCSFHGGMPVVSARIGALSWRGSPRPAKRPQVPCHRVCFVCLLCSWGWAGEIKTTNRCLFVRSFVSLFDGLCLCVFVSMFVVSVFVCCA